MNTNKTQNAVPFYYKLPSGRLIPLLSDPTPPLTKSQIASFEVAAEIGFDKAGVPLK